ncbi:PREDICTED: uncharacterized protein LOC109344554 [Lupinus angustifolius]|uniref:uncharacterized protein LOC109344554 n=1 Tax=Lupinus angustifolius TaxID=3871 RepID=UPI00092E2E7C|nr:PREDICTED: uncharacterized protein LOC109344554 [Lupinus angustifolius]
MTTSNGFAMNLPVLDGKNYDHWSIQMKAIFGFQECREVVLEGVQQLGEDPTEAQKLEFREALKKDCKAIFLIHQCVDHSNFDKISAAQTSKEAWETLERCYGGSTKRNLRILRQIKIDELHGSLEAHEQRLMERQNGWLTQQALSAQFKKKCMNNHDAKKKEADRVQTEKREGSESSSSKQSDIRSSKKWNNQNSYQNNAKKKKDKSRIQCFNCKNYGHYASECKSK